MSKRFAPREYGGVHKRYNKFLQAKRSEISGSESECEESSEDETESSDDEVQDGAHKCRIFAAHIGSLTKLDASDLEINKEQFEFEFSKGVLLFDIIKVCIPWKDIDKIESHFSSDLCALVIHVQQLWARDLIVQLHDDLSRETPLELDPKSEMKYKRVISLEFIKEPPRQHITMMEYYLKQHHRDPRNYTIKSCSCAYIQDFLPPVAHSEDANDTDVEDSRILLVYPLPPAQPSITVKYHDWECLKPEEFLNGAIIDFYLKYIQHKIMSPNVHLFKSCFYKTLTQPIVNTHTNYNASTWMSNSKKMHQHVKEFTKTTDLFSKDYIIVPINEHGHWYLVIICYPWLLCPYYDYAKSWNKHNNRSDEQDKTIDEKDVDGVLSKQREHSTVPPITLRPCILLYDSLVVNKGRNKVVNNLRNYLAEEWETEIGRGPRSFNKQNFPGFFVDGPVQENFYDGGMFLLQFVEKFLETPVRDYRFPVERKNWFSQQDVTRKRTFLRELIIRLGQAEDL